MKTRNLDREGWLFLLLVVLLVVVVPSILIGVHFVYPSIVSIGVLISVVFAVVGPVIGLLVPRVKKQLEGPEYFEHAEESLRDSSNGIVRDPGTDAETLTGLPNSPPSWREIERNRVVEHPLLEDIYEDVREHTNGLVVIEGPPASGKSVALYSLGYRLLHELSPRRSVYTLDTSDVRPEASQLLEDIERMAKDSVLLVDDIHLETSELVRFASLAENKPVTLVYATRPRINYSGSLAEDLASLWSAHHEFAPELVADEIVARFLDNELDLDEAELERAKQQLRPYHDDLYLLRAALSTYRSERTVSDDEIYSWLTERMLAKGPEGTQMKPGPYLIAIACLYRFEVPVTDGYLRTCTEFEREEVEALVETGEILTTADGKYALHHSSVAEMILEAASRNARHLVPSPLETGGRDVDGAAAVEAYVTEEPYLSVDVLAEMANTTAEGRQLATLLLDRLPPDVLASGVTPTQTSIDNLGSFLYLYHRKSTTPPRVVVDNLVAFADDSQNELPGAWAWTTEVLARLDLPVKTIYADRLASLLVGESPRQIANILTSVWYGDSAVSRRIASKIDPESLASRLTAQLEAEDLRPAEVAMIVAKLVWVDDERFDPVAIEFAEMLLNVDAEEFPVLLCRIAWGNQSSARLVVESLSTEEIGSYLNGIDDPRDFYRSVAAIYLVAPEFAVDMRTELSFTPPHTYRTACRRLLESPIDRTDPAVGLQSTTEGTVQTQRFEPSVVCQRLRNCADATPTERDLELESIAGTHNGRDCIIGLLQLGDSATVDIGPERLEAWLTDDVSTESVPSNVQKTAAASLRQFDS